MGSKVDKEVSARAPFKLMCGFVFVFTLRSKSDLAGPTLHFLFAKNCVTAIAIAVFSMCGLQRVPRCDVELGRFPKFSVSHSECIRLIPRKHPLPQYGGTDGERDGRRDFAEQS